MAPSIPVQTTFEVSRLVYLMDHVSEWVLGLSVTLPVRTDLEDLAGQPVQEGFSLGFSFRCDLVIVGNGAGLLLGRVLGLGLRCGQRVGELDAHGDRLSACPRPFLVLVSGYM